MFSHQRMSAKADFICATPSVCALASPIINLVCPHSHICWYRWLNTQLISTKSLSLLFLVFFFIKTFSSDYDGRQTIFALSYPFLHFPYIPLYCAFSTMIFSCYVDEFYEVLWTETSQAIFCSFVSFALRRWRWSGGLCLRRYFSRGFLQQPIMYQTGQQPIIMDNNPDCNPDKAEPGKKDTAHEVSEDRFHLFCSCMTSNSVVGVANEYWVKYVSNLHNILTWWSLSRCWEVIFRII